MSGCSSTPPPKPVPAVRRLAQFTAETAAKLSQAENWPAAAREWQRAGDQFGALNDLANQAVALHNLAQAQRELGQLDRGQSLLERAAGMNQGLGRTNEWWRNQVALLQIESQQPASATLEPHFKRLLPLLPSLESPELRGLFLNELGQWQQRQGRLTEALATYNQAEVAFAKAIQPLGVAAVSANRAQLFVAQTNHVAALKEWRLALAEYEALAEPLGIARALAGQGQTLLRANLNLPEAEELLRRAAQNYRTLKRPGKEVEVLPLLVNCLKAQNKPVVDVQQELAHAHEEYAAHLETSGNLGAARQQWQAAADLWETLRQPEARDKALAGVQRCERKP